MEKLSAPQIEDFLKGLTGWVYEDGFISKSYRFSNFKETFAIMTRIAFECEQLDHHPNWENTYNSLTIKLNTHDVGGITKADIALAIVIESVMPPK